MDRRIKQHCPQGHDTFETGRTRTGGCRSCKLVYNRTYKQQHPEKVADNQLRHDFGISLGDKQIMSEAQSHRCLICEEQKSLVVDHCHKTGLIRGLLCNTCNRAIGLLKDNPIVLQKCADYLKSSQSLAPKT